MNVLIKSATIIDSNSEFNNTTQDILIENGSIINGSIQSVEMNGGEFTNDDFAEMAEKLNTKIITTAADSPCSNGVNERHNGILGEMVLKPMEVTHCSIETALMWCVTAKNALANIYESSPS